MPEMRLWGQAGETAHCSLRPPYTEIDFQSQPFCLHHANKCEPILTRDATVARAAMAAMTLSFRQIGQKMFGTLWKLCVE